MAGWNSTTICNDASLKQCSSSITCPDESLAAFSKTMGGTLWQVNMLILINAILAGVIVGTQRYRYHPFTRFIFLGATTLLLPITSYVVSTISTNSNDYINNYKSANLAATCRGGFHYFTAVSWAFLVQITMINTSVIVAVDDREGQNKGPPIQLLVQGIWALYLGVSTMGPITSNFWPFYLELMPFVIICAKIVLKYYAFEKARQSLAFGHNPRLISGYMMQPQLQESSQPGEPSVGEDVPPPPLLVMGEENIQVDKQPHGYTNFRNNTGLVTVDEVWRLDNDLANNSRPQLKDLCLSFALFKLLRCRFVRNKNTNVTSMGPLNFFWSLLLKEDNHERVFGVITDELSFVQDYYFSSLPVSYSKYWFPILSVSMSLLSITYCLLVTRFIMNGLLLNWKPKYKYQLRCYFWCNDGHLISDRHNKNFGFFAFDDAPLFFLLALVVLAEVRYIASYICSNWTKVALICHYINHASLKHSLRVQKWFNLLLQCKWELMKHWDEKMGQSSLLVLHPRPTLLVLLRHLLGLPNLDSSVEMRKTVKIHIINVLRDSYNRHRLNNSEYLRLSRVGEKFFWACNSKSASDTILTWHIATCLLEVRHPTRHDQEQGSPNTNNKITATHLSRYCAYLMAWSPDLLPDDDEYSKSLYETVKKDAKRALAGLNAKGKVTPEVEYEQVVQFLLIVNSNEVLKNGVRLGEELVGEGEEKAWRVLSEFWSKMILHISPSDNVRGHLKAIARGGELITILWALLTHAGILSWPGDDAGGAATATGSG